MSARDQAATLRGGGRRLMAIDPPRSRAIGVTGGKGGVGKSTIAVNLAVSYALRGARSLALDGDLGMADLNLLLGVAPERSLLDVVDGAEIEDVLVEAHGIHLAPALNGSRRLVGLPAEELARLRRKVEGLRSRFDTLVVDSAAGIGEAGMALTASTVDIVAVATPEPLSLADAYACLKVLARHHNISRVMVLPNMVRSPSEADEVVGRLAGLVARFLGLTLVALPAVPFDPMVSQAAASGIPLVVLAPDSPAARAVIRVARRIDAISADTGRWRGEAVESPRMEREHDERGMLP